MLYQAELRPPCERVTRAPGRTRTPNLRIRSPLLYPVELQGLGAGLRPGRRPIRAGEGNRTLTASLEGWSSTIELHPRIFIVNRSSGWSDSNRRPRAPKARALAKLRHSPRPKGYLSDISCHSHGIPLNRAAQRQPQTDGMQPRPKRRHPTSTALHNVSHRLTECSPKDEVPPVGSWPTRQVPFLTGR